MSKIIDVIIISQLAQLQLAKFVKSSSLSVLTMKVQQVKWANDLIRLGVDHFLYRGNHKHFVFTLNNETDWLSANRFCKNILNATVFVYFSQQELLEILHALGDKPKIVFTGFHAINQVQKK